MPKTDSQALVEWVGGDAAEREHIQAILDAVFYGPDWRTWPPSRAAEEVSPMEGHVKITLAKEKEGWRVVTAIAYRCGFEIGDWREHVIEALHKGGVRLTNLIAACPDVGP